MSRRDIADYLGLTLETVSRALSILRDDCGLTDKLSDSSYCWTGKDLHGLTPDDVSGA